MRLSLAALPLAGTAGQAYVERQATGVEIAERAGVRYIDDFAGRAAVIVGLHDRHGMLRSVHGRYLEVHRRQDKMLAIGPGGGTINIFGGWQTNPLILVEVSSMHCRWPFVGKRVSLLSDAECLGSRRLPQHA